MPNRLWHGLTLRWRRAWRHAFGRVVGREASHVDGDRRVASRAKFWAEFREGRQEAEARADRPRS
jgi:hypothetical protein